MNDKQLQLIHERRKKSRHRQSNIHKRWQEDEKQEKVLRAKQGKKPIRHAMKGKVVSEKEAKRILETSK